MIYLDNAATSWPKAPGVARAMAEAIEQPVGNVGRSAHQPALAASRILYDCRVALQRVMAPTSIEKTIFTRNATEALNIALFGSVCEGDRILTTPVEHNAVARPLHVLASRGIAHDVCVCDAYGAVDPDAFMKELATRRYALAVFTAANNITGALNPIGEMVRACVAYGVPFVIDGAQAVGEIAFPPFVPEASGALCFSLHKGLLGPAGVGVMALHGSFAPKVLLYGGTGSRSDSVEQPDFLPDCHESGTPAIPAIAGAHAAVNHVADHAIELCAVRADRADILYGKLSQIAALRLLSGPSHRLGVISVTVREGTIDALSRALFAHDIAVRAGYHCAPMAHQYFKTASHGGAIRFSVGHATTVEEIERTVRVVEEALSGR